MIEGQCDTSAKSKCYTHNVKTHIVQTSLWGDIKTKLGTTAVRVGNTQFTLHKIPKTPFFVANAPKVNPFEIDFKAVENEAKKHNVIFVNFDVPNVTTESPQIDEATKRMELACVKSPRDTFAKANCILDLTKDEDELLEGMHKKHRYNIRLAQKKGVTVRKANTQNSADFDIFYKLLSETADRQKYYVRGKNYYKTIWETLAPEGKAHILIAEFEGDPLTAWMLLNHDGVLYYPYGGSSENHKNLQHSVLLGWAAIKLGKELNCSSFDMWGAAVDPNNTQDPYYGFTQFKLKYGAKHVLYMDSYDLVIDKFAYRFFNLAQGIRWKILRAIR